VSFVTIDGSFCAYNFLHEDASFFCDGCDTVVTDSYRYKCLQCPDLNLCMICEQRGHRRHLMVRFSKDRMESFSKIYDTLCNLSFNFHCSTELFYHVSIMFLIRKHVEKEGRPPGLLKGSLSFSTLKIKNKLSVLFTGVIQEDSMCLICCKNAKNTILRPCRHAYNTCKSCTRKLCNKCPICKAAYLEIETFFM
jgi:Zinc finger, C3HC4 type (RING finger)/Zinc finger, ZZ type